MPETGNNCKFTLIPTDFFDRENPRGMLSEAVALDDEDTVGYAEVPQYNAVLLYGGNPPHLPEIYHILQALDSCPEYNKILCSHVGGRLYIAIAQGRNLLLANSYAAPDFTTAEYYIFRAFKALQLNPEVSVIAWRLPISPDDTMSLYRYFKDVMVL